MANTPLTTGIQPAQPHTMGNAGPPPGSFPPMSMQFQPVGPPSQQPFAQATPQQYPLGGHLNMGMLPPPPPPVQYHQAAQTSLQHPPSRSQPPSLQQPPQPPSQIPVFSGYGQSQEPPVPPPDFHRNGHVMSSSSQPHLHNSLASTSGGPRFSHVSYDLPSSSDGQQQTNVGSTATQTDTPSYSVGHPWFTIGNQQLQSVLPSQQVAEQRSGSQAWFLGGTQNVKPVTPSHQNDGKSAVGQQWHLNGSQNESSGTGSQPTAGQTVINIKNTLNDQAKTNSSDWTEHTSPLGKKYYYNKKTKISSWEKPLELMTPTERADASTDWKEHTASEGRRFYFNKVTKRSRWAIPDEVKLAREQVGLASSDVNPIAEYGDPASAVLSISGAEASSSNGNAVSLSTREMVPSPISAGATNTELPATSGPSSIQEVAAATAVMSTPLRTSEQDAGPSYKETLQGSLEEAIKGAETPGNRDVSTPELKNVEHGPSVYENKEEAKIAFKALLETANVGSDWNWDQVMRVIINDRRYGALRTLGERKQAFNEFVGLKKKKEAEEKRAKQRKTKEDFKIMLQECKDLASSMRWSKAVSVFEKDERFQAVERIKDREDLFEDYLEELKKKERAKASEEHKRHKTEYLEFLKSCNFIKANSQWRKVQHRLEADERCSRLEKIERLEIFQEYLRDLEMEEEEQRKLRMEGMRKTERKNRDEFRKLLEEHAAHGFLTIKSNWRDYEMQVKETPAYISVSSNTSGPTAEHLFEDVIDDLEKQYLEDKERTEEAIMNQKIALSLASTLEDFKNALSKEINLKSISDANVKLIFNELLEVTKERDEKEAKRCKRLAKDVYELLFNSNEVTSSSKWEDCKTFVKERFIGEENFFQDIFDTVIMELREKEKQKDRKKKEDQRQREKRDRKSKDRHRKDRERRKMDEAGSEGSKSSGFEEKKRSRGKSKMCRRQDADSFDPTSLDDDEKAHSTSHRHSKQKGSIFMEGDSESEFKRQKRDHLPVFVEDQKAEEGEVQ